MDENIGAADAWEPVEIRGSRTFDRTVFVVLLLGFLAAFTGLVSMGLQEAVGTLRGLGYLLSGGFMGAGVVTLLRRATDGRPRLIISESGLIDRTGLFSDGIEIPWAQVKELKRGFGPFIRVDLFDPETAFAQMNVFERAIRRLGYLLGGAPITIVTSGLDRGPTELIQLLEYREAHAALEAVHDEAEQLGP